MNPPFAGTKRVLQSDPCPIDREDCANSGGVVLIEVFALKLDDLSGQQFSIRIGHSDEAAMEAIRVQWVGDGINTQYLEVRLKEHLAGKEQGAGENGVHLEDLVERDADPAGADINGPLDERGFCLVGFLLQADGERDGNTIILAAVFA